MFFFGFCISLLFHLALIIIIILSFLPGVWWTQKMSSATFNQSRCLRKCETGWRQPLPDRWAWCWDAMRKNLASAASSMPFRLGYLLRGIICVWWTTTLPQSHSSLWPSVLNNSWPINLYFPPCQSIVGASKAVSRLEAVQSASWVWPCITNGQRSWTLWRAQCSKVVLKFDDKCNFIRNISELDYADAWNFMRYTVCLLLSLLMFKFHLTCLSEK